MASPNGPGPQVPIDATEAEMKLRALMAMAQQANSMIRGLPEPNFTGGPLAQAGRMPQQASNGPGQSQSPRTRGIESAANIPAPRRQTTPETRRASSPPSDEAYRPPASPRIPPQRTYTYGRVESPQVGLPSTLGSTPTFGSNPISAVRSIGNLQGALRSPLSAIARMQALGPVALGAGAFLAAAYTAKQIDSVTDDVLTFLRRPSEHDSIEDAVISSLDQAAVGLVKSLGRELAETTASFSKAGGKLFALGTFVAASALNVVFGDDTVDADGILDWTQDRVDKINALNHWAQRDTDEYLKAQDQRLNLSVAFADAAALKLLGLGLPGSKSEIAAAVFEKHERQTRDANLDEQFANDRDGISLDARAGDRRNVEYGKAG